MLRDQALQPHHAGVAGTGPGRAAVDISLERHRPKAKQSEDSNAAVPESGSSYSMDRKRNHATTLLSRGEVRSQFLLRHTDDV